jgi:hypothetical protein
MTIKVTITASAAGPGQHALAQYEERLAGHWYSSKRGPIPLTPDKPEELWVHDGQRVTVYEVHE